jgi:hypothetical protein
LTTAVDTIAGTILVIGMTAALRVCAPGSGTHAAIRTPTGRKARETAGGIDAPAPESAFAAPDQQSLGGYSSGYTRVQARRDVLGIADHSRGQKRETSGLATWRPSGLGGLVIVELSPGLHADSVKLELLG